VVGIPGIGHGRLIISPPRIGIRAFGFEVGWVSRVVLACPDITIDPDLQVVGTVIESIPADAVQIFAVTTATSDWDKSNGICETIHEGDVVPNVTIVVVDLGQCVISCNTGLFGPCSIGSAIRSPTVVSSVNPTACIAIADVNLKRKRALVLDSYLHSRH